MRVFLGVGILLLLLLFASWCEAWVLPALHNRPRSSVTRCLCAGGGGGGDATPNKVKFRNVQLDDISSLAEMCAETFEGPFSWLEGLKKRRYEDEFRGQFRDRYTRLVQGGIQHAMILGEAPGQGSPEVVAFLEVGLLPSPVAVAATWEGQETETRPEVPFLGNVAVTPARRRQGLASKLVKLGEAVARKWGHGGLFVAVEADNVAALALYRRLSFCVVLDERDQMNRRGNRVFMRKEVGEGAASASSSSSSSSSSSGSGSGSTPDAS